jgi:hypothetical protein
MRASPGKAIPRPGRKVTVGDLRRLQTRQGTHELYCSRCGGTYSADVADYFNRPDYKPLKCCGINNVLIVLR